MRSVTRRHVSITTTTESVQYVCVYKVHIQDDNELLYSAEISVSKNLFATADFKSIGT